MKVDGIVSSPNPLVMTNNLLWKMAIDIVDLPIKNGGFPMLNYQRVQYGWKIWKSGVLMGCKWSDVPLPLITPVILVIFMGKKWEHDINEGLAIWDLWMHRVSMCQLCPVIFMWDVCGAYRYVCTMEAELNVRHATQSGNGNDIGHMLWCFLIIPRPLCELMAGCELASMDSLGSLVRKQILPRKIGKAMVHQYPQQSKVLLELMLDCTRLRAGFLSDFRKATSAKDIHFR